MSPKAFERRVNCAVCHGSPKGQVAPRFFLGVIRIDRPGKFWIKIYPDTYETGEPYYLIELQPMD